MPPSEIESGESVSMVLKRSLPKIAASVAPTLTMCALMEAVAYWHVRAFPLTSDAGASPTLAFLVFGVATAATPDGLARLHMARAARRNTKGLQAESALGFEGD